MIIDGQDITDLKFAATGAGHRWLVSGQDSCSWPFFFLSFSAGKGGMGTGGGNKKRNKKGSSPPFLGANAFRDCTGLRQIRLPKNCAIDDSAFDGCTGLITIYGPAGGTTKNWADRNKVPFAAE